MSVEDRLRAVGVELPKAPIALGRYRFGHRHGELVYVSGQTGTRDGEPVWTGVVGDSLSIDRARDSARLAAVNVLVALREVVGDLELVRAIVRTTIYVNAARSFTEHPRVADAVTEVFESAYGDAGVGARAAIGVHSLPQGAPVEVETTVQVGEAP